MSGESFLRNDKWEISIKNEWQGFQKFTNGYGGTCMNGESFLRNDKWQIKLLSEFFTNSHSTFYK